MNNFNFPVETYWVPLEVIHKFTDDFRVSNVEVKLSTHSGYHSDFIEITDPSYEDHFNRLLNDFEYILISILGIFVLII